MVDFTVLVSGGIVYKQNVPKFKTKQSKEFFNTYFFLLQITILLFSKFNHTYNVYSTHSMTPETIHYIDNGVTHSFVLIHKTYFKLESVVTG